MFRESRLALAIVIFFASHLLFPSVTFASQDKVKISALLVNGGGDRSKACNGDFTKTVIDFAIMYKDKDKINQYPSCVIKTLSNTPVTGTQYLQIKQNGEWVDICSLSFWADRVSRKDCSQKFDSKENLGKISGKNSWVCTFRNACSGLIDYGTFSLGRFTNIDGDFCNLTDIDNIDLRVRVTSKTKEYFSNPVSFVYLNADKVIFKKNIGYNGQCVLSTLPASAGKPIGQTTNGSSATPLPQCSVTQIRYHSTLAKSFNEFRNLYLRSTDEINKAISSYTQAQNNGSTYNMERWLGILGQARALAQSTANDAISEQNKLISLMQECKFNYGIIVTEPYGFITTDENFTGYKFPSFPIR